MRALPFLLFLPSLLPFILAEELQSKDVPAACATICAPIVQLTSLCDTNPPGSSNQSDKGEADEPIEAQCICTNTSFNVKSVAALCAACLVQNKGKGGEGWFSDIMGCRRWS